MEHPSGILFAGTRLTAIDSRALLFGKKSFFISNGTGYIRGLF